MKNKISILLINIIISNFLFSQQYNDEKSQDFNHVDLSFINKYNNINGDNLSTRSVTIVDSLSFPYQWSQFQPYGVARGITWIDSSF